MRVAEGRLESVKAVVSQDARESPVPGRVSGDGRTWRPDDERLALAAKYTVDAVAVDGSGRRSARHTTFTTHVPEERFIGYVAPRTAPPSAPGRSSPWSSTGRSPAGPPWSAPCGSPRAPPSRSAPTGSAAEHASTSAPEHYWKPGTEVTVELDLRDVEGAPGVYGLQRRTFTFTVGRSQVTVVDAAAHTMRVRRDGELLATVPVTAGAAKTPTYNGKMVITEMLEVTRMNSRTVGFGGEYDIPDVPHAIRLTSSGTFLHGNYWADPEVFGSDNVSHGCVGLRDVKGGGADTPAGWFFDRSLIGDVVEVVNSKDRTVAPDNGLGGWNMNWKEWKAGSAVNRR